MNRAVPFLNRTSGVSFYPVRSLLQIALLLAILLSSRTARAADVTAEFDAANRLFEQGKFVEAATGYEAILKTGIVSTALYFNLGNARFKSGQLGQAISAFRRAEHLSPRDPDLQANLRFVRDRVQGPTSPPSGWKRWLARLTLNEWTWFAAVPFWICLLLLTAMQFRRNSRRTFGGLAALAGTGALISGICLGLAWELQTTPGAVVIAREAVVRNGPLEESQSAFTVRDGAELQVLDQKNDWLQVGTGNRIGWVKRNHVELLQTQS